MPLWAGGHAGKPQPSLRAENVEIEETLGALERALKLGNSKLSLQRLVYVNELVDCAHEVGYEPTVAHLLPVVRRLASDPEVQVRQSLVQHFGDLAGFLIQSDPEKGYQKVVDDLLPVVSGLLSDPEVRQGAAEALTTLASHLRPGERGDRVLMTVIQLSQSNEDEDARSTAVGLFSSLAEALGRDFCQQFVVVELQALCEDPSFRVRKTAAASFAEVSRVVGDGTVLSRLLPAFKRLVQDPHWGVRKAAAEGLKGLLRALRAEGRDDATVPLMGALLKDVSRWVRVAALQELGYFIAELESPSRASREGLLDQYVEIIARATKANDDAADISYHCAFTFAAVTRAMGKEFWPALQAPFVSLCRDSQLKTRKAMAASMHVVAQTLGAELTEKDVLPQLEAVLGDPVHEVRLAALRNVASVLRAAPGSGPQRRVTVALQAAMGRAETWRLRQHVASQLGTICEALAMTAEPSSAASDAQPVAAAAAAGSAEGESCVKEAAHAKDMIWSIVVPLFFQLCCDPVAEVRDAAARSAAQTLRAAAPEISSDVAGGLEGSSGASSGAQLPLQPDTQGLVRRLITDFAMGHNFRSRMCYIRMCDSVIRELPLYVFTSLFLKPLIRLAVDRVKNVRLCFAAAMLPHLRRVGGRLGRNRSLVLTARKMRREDSDREVRRVLAPCTEALGVPDQDLVGPEPDWDDQAEDGWLAPEGGTGGPGHLAAEQAPHAGAASSGGGRCPSAASSGAREKERDSAAPAAPANVLSRPAPVQPPLSPGSAPGSPSQAGSFDPVEEGLVAQADMERELDATYADRRLLVEAKQRGEAKDFELPQTCAEYEDDGEEEGDAEAFAGAQGSGGAAGGAASSGPRVPEQPRGAEAAGAQRPPAAAAAAPREAAAPGPAPAEAEAPADVPAEVPAEVPAGAPAAAPAAAAALLEAEAPAAAPAEVPASAPAAAPAAAAALPEAEVPAAAPAEVSVSAEAEAPASAPAEADAPAVAAPAAAEARVEAPAEAASAEAAPAEAAPAEAAPAEAPAATPAEADSPAEAEASAEAPAEAEARAEAPAEAPAEAEAPVDAAAPAAAAPPAAREASARSREAAGAGEGVE